MEGEGVGLVFLRAETRPHVIFVAGPPAHSRYEAGPEVLMQSFQRFDRSTSLLIALLVMAFLLATFDVRTAGGGVGTTMREGAQTLFSPLQDVASAVTRPVVGFIDALSDIASLREENEALRQENAELQTEMDQFESVQAEIDHLREINDLKAPDDLPTVTAQINSPGSSQMAVSNSFNALSNSPNTP